MGTTEKQKMLAGEHYFAYDEELNKDRGEATSKMAVLNAATTDNEQRLAAEALFGRVGPGCYVRPNFRCDYGYNIMLGDNVTINYDCVFLDCGKITIGDHTDLGPGVHVYAVTHPLNPDDRKTQLEQGKDVTIGEGCWIGGGAIICPGVTIGNGSTIGAGAVVTKDIPDNVLAVGNPAKVVKSVK